MEKFKFTPESGFRDGTAYPNPTSEANTREMFQRPLDQLRDYINQLLGIIPTDEQLQQMVTNHDLILELEKAVKQLEENSNSYAEYDEETGNLQINSAMDILALFKQLSNPNLLINSDFRNPVNQRGATNYTSTTEKQVYTIDRWMLHDAGSLTVNEGFISFNGTGLKQWIEMPKFIEQSYTLSVKYKDKDAKVFNFDNYDGSYKEISVDGYKCALQYASSIKALMVILWNSANAIEVEWCKLEQGSIATPFVPRQYAEELALCQRYYIKYSSAENDLHFPCSDVYGKRALVSFELPAQMRDIPTATYTICYLVDNTGSWIKVTSINGVRLAQNHLMIKFNVDSNLSNYSYCYAIVQSSAGGYIAFDAEIY